jgi:hypothetical protein
MKRTAKMCPQYLSGAFKEAREEDKWYRNNTYTSHTNYGDRK